MTEAEVIIIGGGPVGPTLACDLSYRAVQTILLEQSTRIGLEKKIQNASFSCDVPFSIGFYTALLNGYTMFKNTFDSWGDIVDGKL